MIELSTQARRAEKESKWTEALRLWKLTESRDNNPNTKAVQFIIDSIAKGDAYRERTWNKIHNMCYILKENNVYDVSDLRRVERVLLNYYGNDYNEVDLLHIQNIYDEYLDNGYINWEKL